MCPARWPGAGAPTPIVSSATPSRPGTLATLPWRESGTIRLAAINATIRTGRFAGNTARITRGLRMTARDTVCTGTVAQVCSVMAMTVTAILRYCKLTFLDRPRITCESLLCLTRETS